MTMLIADDRNLNSTPFWKDFIVRGDLFQEFCDHTFWNNAHPVPNPHFKAGSIVFCKIDAVLSLFEQLRLTRKQIVLVTGEGDFPCDAFRQKFLPKNVLHWFSTNVTHPHPRVSAIPLGLGSPDDPVTLKSSEFLAAQQKATSKDHWLLVAFRPETNRRVRQKIYDYFKQRSEHESWITFQPPSVSTSHDFFLTQLTRHHFILCPPGNGVDTHRLWETLTAGSYPIVLRSQAMMPFEELPILFVNHIEEITLDFLQQNLQQLEEKKKNLSMLTMPFWEQKIQSAKSELAGQELMPWRDWLEESIRYVWSMFRGHTCSRVR
ncbi:MAG: exostosin domain-containing protein [Chthoniobacterales bacterium]